MRTKRKAGIIAILAVLLFAAMAAAGTAYAADSSVPALARSTEVLSTGYNTSDAATVMYGDTGWRVIGYNGDGAVSESGSVTLLAGKLLGQSQFYRYNGVHSYKGSYLREAVDAITKGLSQGEQAAVMPRLLESGVYNGLDTDCISGGEVEDALWPLSVAEALRVDWSLRIIDPENTALSANNYWLRSPGSYYNTAHIIQGNGNSFANGASVDIGYGVRPAFYLDSKAVVFLSPATGGKVSGASSNPLAEVGTYAGNEWKLTLHDDAHKDFSVDSATMTSSGSLEIEYSGAAAGENEVISAIVTDSSGKIKYYGNLAPAKAGMSKVTVPVSGKWNPNGTDRLYVFNEQCNGDHKTDYVSELYEITSAMLNNDGSFPGAGTEADPYQISDKKQWDVLADQFAAGQISGEVHIKLDGDFRTDRMIGTKEMPFHGTVDGNGHTLTFYYTATEASCGPFRYAGNATFLNLRTAGTINTNKGEASGLVANAKGNVKITNCVSDIHIKVENRSGNHAGFVSYVEEGGHVDISGSVFTGRIAGESAAYCAGFIGWDTGNTSTILNCVYDGAMETAGQSSTFVRTTDVATNSYYFQPIGQGRDKGKQARSVTGAEDVQISFGDGTEYNVSGITAYPAGMVYGGVFYAGKGERVAMTLPDHSDDGMEYFAGTAILPGSGTDYQLEMPDEDVVITMQKTRLPRPKTVRLDVNEQDGLILLEKALTAVWSTVDDADGYILSVYKVDNGQNTELCDPIDLRDLTAEDGMLSYDLSQYVLNDHDLGAKSIMFAVKAYNDAGLTSNVISSAGVDICRMELEIGSEVRDRYLLKGSVIASCLSALFRLNDEDVYGYNGLSEAYFYKMNDGTWIQIKGFIPHPITTYSSLAEMSKDAYQGPDITPSEAVISDDIRVYTALESDICTDGDLHAWTESQVLQKATTSTAGLVEYTCSKCGNAKCQKSVAPVSGFALAKSSYTYTGKALKPKVTVSSADGTLLDGTDYTVQYKGNVNAGTAKAVVTLIGHYEGTKELKFTIQKAANTLKIKAKKAKVKYQKLKKGKQTLKVSKVIKVTRKGQGKLTYQKVKGNKKITINKKTGKVTLKKGLKKGTYKVKVRVKAAGNSNYKPSGWKTVTMKIIVK